MADVEFSNYAEGLDAASSLTGSEIVPVSQSGTAVRTTAQAIANKASIPASQISDSTTTGRSVLTAADASEARTAIGAGTSSFSGAYADLSGKPTLGTAAALDVAASGDAASGEVVKGNDTRLSDSRAPTSAGLAATITGATSKTTPVDADELPLADSAASYGLKKLTWANLKATAKTYFDTLYQPLAAYLTSWAAIDPSTKQDTLVSGSNIKTINGSSVLGSGDLTVGGASPGGSGPELQYRIDASTFGAVTGSSVDGASLTLGGETVTASKPVLNLSQTWNGAGVTMTGARVNVTDTASAAASMLLDLQVGGTSRVKVRKDGSLLLSNAASFDFGQKNPGWFVFSTNDGSYDFGVGSGGVSSVRYLLSSFASGATSAALEHDSTGRAKITDGNGGTNYRDLTLRNLIGTGNITTGIVTKTANYTATANDGTIEGDATSGAITITLPATASSAGRIYVIKKIDSSGNAVTVDPNASETIDGATTVSLSSQYSAIIVQCNYAGTAWHKLASI